MYVSCVFFPLLDSYQAKNFALKIDAKTAVVPAAAKRECYETVGRKPPVKPRLGGTGRRLNIPCASVSTLFRRDKFAWALWYRRIPRLCSGRAGDG